MALTNVSDTTISDLKLYPLAIRFTEKEIATRSGLYALSLLFLRIGVNILLGEEVLAKQNVDRLRSYVNDQNDYPTLSGWDIYLTEGNCSALGETGLDLMREVLHIIRTKDFPPVDSYIFKPVLSFGEISNIDVELALRVDWQSTLVSNKEQNRFLSDLMHQIPGRLVLLNQLKQRWIVSRDWYETVAQLCEKLEVKGLAKKYREKRISPKEIGLSGPQNEFSAGVIKQFHRREDIVSLLNWLTKICQHHSIHLVARPAMLGRTYEFKGQLEILGQFEDFVNFVMDDIKPGAPERLGERLSNLKQIEQNSTLPLADKLEKLFQIGKFSIADIVDTFNLADDFWEVGVAILNGLQPKPVAENLFANLFPDMVCFTIEKLAAYEKGEHNWVDISVDTKCLPCFGDWLKAQGYSLIRERHATRIDGAEEYEGRFENNNSKTVGRWKVIYLDAHWFHNKVYQFSPTLWRKVQVSEPELEPNEDPNADFSVAVQPLYAICDLKLAAILKAYEGNFHGTRPKRAVEVYNNYCRGRNLF